MSNEEFQIIVEQYQKLVFSICYQLTHDYHESQNLAQDTFLSAYTHIDTIKKDHLKAWLAKIAANKAKDYLKSAYYRRISISEDIYEIEIGSTELTPVESYENKDGEGRIKNIVYALKEPYHKVAVLFFIEERTPEEIAGILERPEKTVRTQLYRARNILRKQLEGFNQE